MRQLLTGRRMGLSGLMGMGAAVLLAGLSGAQAQPGDEALAERYPVSEYTCAFGKLNQIKGKPATCAEALPALKADFGIFEACAENAAGTPAKVVLDDRIELFVVTAKTSLGGPLPVIVAFDRKTGVNHYRWFKAQTMVEGEDMSYALKGIEAVKGLPDAVPAVRLTFESSRRMHSAAPAKVRTEGGLLAFPAGEPRWVSAWTEKMTDDGKVLGSATAKLEGDKVTITSTGEGVTASGSYAAQAELKHCPKVLLGED